MPNLSFLGHLSGIIAGTLQLHGIALIPKESYLRGMDDWNTLRWLSSTESFVGTMSIQTTPARNALNLVQLSANRGFRAIITLFSNATGKFIVAIFRRGRAANSNIQLDSLLGSQSESSTDDYSESRDRMPPVSSEVPRPTISQIL